MILIFMVEGARAVNLLLHAVSNSREHGGTARQHDVAVQILTDINVALHDGVVGGLVDASRFHAQEGGLEEGLGATESLVTDGDDLAVRKLVGLLESRGRSSRLHLLLKVQGNVAQASP